MPKTTADLKTTFNEFTPTMKAVFNEAVENAIHVMNDMHDMDSMSPQEYMEVFTMERVNTAAQQHLAQLLDPLHFNDALVTEEMKDALTWVVLNSAFIAFEKATT